MFGRKEFAERLTRVITTFYPFYDDAFVLSLNAKFGSGKTTFLKMWEKHLDEQGYQIISINAWETDFDDEPLIPIIGAILNKINSQTGSVKIKKALGAALGVTAIATNQIAKQATGVDVSGVTKEMENFLDKDNIKKLGDDLYETYSFKKKAYSELRNELAKYVNTLNNKPLVIFVDELDRVRPDYSVKFLEAIKHIFPIQGVCFVLAVDRRQLEVSVKQLYGNLDFENYYRRFITREANLPEVVITNLRPFIDRLGKVFFDEKRDVGVHFPFIQTEQNQILNFISNISAASQLVPRQIEGFFRIFSQFMTVAEVGERAGIERVKAASFLIVVSIDNPDLYSKIGMGKATPVEVSSYIKNLTYTGFEGESPEREFLFIAMSFLLRNTEDGEEEKELALICLDFDDGVFMGDNDKDQAIRTMIINLRGSARHISARSRFQQLYDMIEDWRPFIE